MVSYIVLSTKFNIFTSILGSEDICEQNQDELEELLESSDENEVTEKDEESENKDLHGWTGDKTELITKQPSMKRTKKVKCINTCNCVAFTRYHIAQKFNGENLDKFDERIVICQSFVY